MSKIAGVVMFFVVIGVVYIIFSKLLAAENLKGVVPLFSLPRVELTTTSTPSKGRASITVKRTTESVYTKIEESQKQIVPPPGFSLQDLSPYYKKIRLGSLRQPDAYSGGEFVLRADHSLKEEINITGWRVRDNKNHEISIPQAIGEYNFLGAQYQNDIVLGANNYVYFYGARGPVVNGLRLNKCTGYLNQTYNFTPKLPMNCPRLYDRSEISVFSGKCQDFILSVNSCTEPDLSKFYATVPSSDSLCRSFLDRFNYRGCYLKYSSDKDFYSNEWRVWLDSALPFDPLHDRILLFDRSGLLVDEYVY